ncbi:MAG: hypothetical protein ACO396_05345 [Phycisphaerales bacterium]
MPAIGQHDVAAAAARGLAGEQLCDVPKDGILGSGVPDAPELAQDRLDVVAAGVGVVRGRADDDRRDLVQDSDVATVDRVDAVHDVLDVVDGVRHARAVLLEELVVAVDPDLGEVDRVGARQSALVATHSFEAAGAVDVHVEQVVAAAASVGHDRIGVEHQMFERTPVRDGERIDRFDHQIGELRSLHHRPELAVLDRGEHGAVGDARDGALVGADRRRVDRMEFAVAAVLVDLEVCGAKAVADEVEGQRSRGGRHDHARFDRIAFGKRDRLDRVGHEVEANLRGGLTKRLRGSPTDRTLIGGRGQRTELETAADEQGGREESQGPEAGLKIGHAVDLFWSGDERGAANRGDLPSTPRLRRLFRTIDGLRQVPRMRE